MGYDKSKMMVISNGYDLTKFYPDVSKRESFRKELNIDEATFFFEFAGRFHKDKGTRRASGGIWYYEVQQFELDLSFNWYKY